MGLAQRLSAAPFAARLTADPIAGGLLEARITHVRFLPRRYVLSHKLSYLRLPLTSLARVPRLFLARNRLSLFSLYDSDYGEAGCDLDTWLSRAFAAVGAERPRGETHLVTLPRALGFGFNPVSFWLCRNEAGGLSAVLAEVNNTFGERHCYLCRKPDGSPIGPEDQIDAEKVFHVSPFMPVDGHYRFRFIERANRLAIQVDLHREGRRALSATIAGRLAPLTSASLFKSFLAHPFPTLQVLGLIHYHASRLYLAGHSFFTKPEPPHALISTSADRTAQTRAPSAPEHATEPL